MALQSRPTGQQPNDPEQERRHREHERRERERRRREEEGNGEPEAEAGGEEQSRPSGEQDATLPGSTPETSTHMPKKGEQSEKGGKSPLKFDPNAPAVDTVARKDKLRVEGKLDEKKSPQRQIHSSALPPDRGPEAAWEEYIVQAAQGAYPRLRLGVDYAVGRREYDSEPELLDVSEGIQVDFGKIKEAAQKLAGSNPYSDYKPKKSLGSQPRDEGYELGERHWKEEDHHALPPSVAQSEVNPQTQDKVPSQAWPGSDYDPNVEAPKEQRQRQEQEPRIPKGPAP